MQLLCSTFGRKLAALYGIDFIDADEFHPASNVGVHTITQDCCDSICIALTLY